MELESFNGEISEIAKIINKNPVIKLGYFSAPDLLHPLNSAVHLPPRTSALCPQARPGYCDRRSPQRTVKESSPAVFYFNQSNLV
jgi:hypothetical protein